MHINRPSILLLAFILALTQSTASHPIQTSKWVKIEQFQDPNDRGIWKVFEKEGYHDQLPDPPHVKYDGNPAWPTIQTNKEEQETPNDRYKTGTSEWGKPTVSILVPASPEIPDKMDKPYSSQQTGEMQDNHSEDKASSTEPLDAQKQDYYEIPQYSQSKGALDDGHKYTAPAFFSHTSSSGWTSFLAYRLPFPTSRAEAVALSQYPLPRVFTIVIILLVLVWAAMFTVGLLELVNYLWRWRVEALSRKDIRGPHCEEEHVSFDENMKVPLTIVISPSENTRPDSAREHEYRFLESSSSDYESDSDSESDEDDYRFF